MTTVKFALGREIFPEWQAPCTSVGKLKRALLKGALGSALPHATELLCRVDGDDAPLQDGCRIPSPPQRLRFEGATSLLRLLRRLLLRELGPPELDESGLALEAVEERLVGEALNTWEEVCRAVGASTAGLFFPAGFAEQWSERRNRRVLWLAGRPKRRKAPEPQQWPLLGQVRRPAADSASDSEAEPKADGDDLSGVEIGEEVGGWKVLRKLGHGHIGEVFLVQRRGVGQKVALKWTLEPHELGTWQAIQRLEPGCPGLPPLLDSGFHKNERFAVTQLLGKDLRWLLPHFKNRSRGQRWRAVRVLGRMLLRRLQAMHRCGYVHCDVSPYNVLFGCTEEEEDGGPGPALVPYLIDFGLARAHPGQPLGAEHGTVEFVSVRSASGGPRLPEDDLEALGWVMAYLVMGQLPWMGWEAEAEEALRLRPVQQPNAELEMRLSLAERTRQAKCEALCRRKLDVPPELEAFLQACSWADPAPIDPPDYELLAGLLGGRPGLETEQGEREDIAECRGHVVSLL